MPITTRSYPRDEDAMCESTLCLIPGKDGVTRVFCKNTAKKLHEFVSAPPTDRIPVPSRRRIVALWLGVFAGLSIVGLALLWLCVHLWIAATRVAP